MPNAYVNARPLGDHALIDPGLPLLRFNAANVLPKLEPDHLLNTSEVLLETVLFNAIIIVTQTYVSPEADRAKAKAQGGTNSPGPVYRLDVRPA